ncbi:MAG: ABC transporter substrate-binding protein [Armatimonadota bacterium]
MSTPTNRARTQKVTRGRCNLTRREFLKLTGAGAAAAALGASPRRWTKTVYAATGPRKNVVMGLFGEPPQLNEFYRSDIVGGIVVQNIYSKLSRVNYKARKVEPELAESWSNPDPLTWVIKLRRGIQWHKGFGDFTAEDVEYTFNYILDKRTFQIGTALFPVERTRALDKYTVEVKLRRPFAALPTVTMEYGGHIICKRAHEEMGPERYGRNPIGTGPFEFDSWRPGSQIVLKKNPRYWKQGTPYLDEIAYRFIPDAQVRLAALRKGEIDFTMSPDAKDVPALRGGKDPNIVYTSVPGWNWDYISFTFPPHVAADFPTQKREVRQAIAYAVDRETIAKEIYFGEALVTDSPIPPGFRGYRKVPIRYPRNADLTKARELMQRAGVSGFDIEVITSDKEWLRRETELAAGMLSQIGIRVRVNSMDIGTYNTRWLGHRYTMNLEDISIVSPDTDSALYWFQREGTVGWHGWQNAEVTEMLDRARVETNPILRDTLYQKTVDAVHEDCPYIYLVHVNLVRLFRKGLTGYDPGPQEFVILMDKVRWA